MHNVRCLSHIPGCLLAAGPAHCVVTVPLLQQQGGGMKAVSMARRTCMDGMAGLVTLHLIALHTLVSEASQEHMPHDSSASARTPPAAFGQSAKHAPSNQSTSSHDFGMEMLLLVRFTRATACRRRLGEACGFCLQKYFETLLLCVASMCVFDTFDIEVYSVMNKPAAPMGPAADREFLPALFERQHRFTVSIC